MKKATVNQITFTQATDNKKAVVADKYVAYAIYTQNKPIWEALGGTRVEGEAFRVEFPTQANAKSFIAQAITGMSKKEYNATRKTEPKAKATAPASTKGKAKATAEFITLTDAKGNTFQVPASLITKVEPPKAKGKSKVKADKPTPAPNAKANKKAPSKTKGNSKVDFSKLAGKGSAANKEAAALMRKAGITDGTSAEYKAVWAEWCKVR